MEDASVATQSASPRTVHAELEWEWHAFEGSRRDVAVRLYALPRELVDQSVYLLLLKGDERSGVWVFVREPASPRLVTVWESGARDLDELQSAILQAVVGRESAPPAERLLAVVEEHGSFVRSEPSLAPVSARGAFGRPVDFIGGHNAQAWVLVLPDPGESRAADGDEN